MPAAAGNGCRRGLSAAEILAFTGNVEPVSPDEAGRRVARLKAAYPRRELEPETVAVCVAFLLDFVYEEASACLSVVVATSRFLPGIAEVREAIAARALGAPAGELAWLQVEAALRRFGRAQRDVDFPWGLLAPADRQGSPRRPSAGVRSGLQTRHPVSGLHGVGSRRDIRRRPFPHDSRPSCDGGRGACMRGIRLAVGIVVGLPGAGHSFDDVLRAHAYLEKDDIQAALAYATWRSEEIELPLKAS